MDQPLQLIFLTPGFPIDEADTSCIPALQDFVLGWKKKFPGLTLRVISFQYPHQSGRYFWNGIPVYCAGGKDGGGILKFITWLKVFIQLIFTKQKNKTVFISYFLTEATYVTHIFSRVFNIKQIAVAAGQDVTKENPYLKRINRQALTITTFNERMSDELFLSCGKHADYIVPMGIEDSEPGIFSNEQLSGNNNIRKIDLLMVGSLIPLKRMDVAIRMIAEVKKDFPAISATIIGDGPEKKTLETLAAHPGLKSNVVFEGVLPREKVFEKMLQSKILLHTSSYEGQSTVITEALACGMTVVCFDIGRISNDTGKIKVCTDERNMLETLKELFRENHFDFTSVVPFHISDTIDEYFRIMGVINHPSSKHL